MDAYRTVIHVDGTICKWAVTETVHVVSHYLITCAVHSCSYIVPTDPNTSSSSILLSIHSSIAILHSSDHPALLTLYHTTTAIASSTNTISTTGKVISTTTNSVLVPTQQSSDTSMEEYTVQCVIEFRIIIIGSFNIESKFAIGILIAVLIFFIVTSTVLIAGSLIIKSRY